MANSRSARKRIRANERKHVRNRSVRSAVRTNVTKARRAMLGEEAATPETSLLVAVSALDRAAEKGIIHRNNAARRKSRLMALANKLSVAATAGDEAAARDAAVGGEKGRSRRAASAKAATPRQAATGTASATAASTKAASAKAASARAAAAKGEANGTTAAAQPAGDAAKRGWRGRKKA